MGGTKQNTVTGGRCDKRPGQEQSDAGRSRAHDIISAATEREGMVE